ETVKDSDMKRFANLDVVIAANLTWGSMDSVLYTTVEVKRLGEERAFNAYPYKSVLDAGAVVSGATDYPAGAVPSPIAAYIVAVTRNSTDDPKMIRDPSQKMTVDEALRVLTYGGAYQMRQEKFRGTIEVGKKADLIILDTNLLKSHSVKTLETKVLLNVIDGNVIYKAG
ncbi:amidohydrolase family protein, partial [Pedobacter sp.]|uniref:amidohydrolase family protein n=1 Tax=Pedobacter sp. TaxID=1411316 RepID=UPI003D7F7796